MAICANFMQSNSQSGIYIHIQTTKVVSLLISIHNPKLRNADLLWENFFFLLKKGL